jgi:hypothetical protein
MLPTFAHGENLNLTRARESDMKAKKFAKKKENPG